MIPVQMIRVGLGDESIHVPVFRVAYAGRDAFGQPGGFFLSADGDFGIVVDARLTENETQAFAAAELQRNLPRLTALVRERLDRARRASLRASAC
jgi:hypothetical protein